MKKTTYLYVIRVEGIPLPHKNLRCIGQPIKIMSKMTLKQIKQKNSKIGKSMLEWNEILENNPSFDNVYDYIQSTFIAGTGKPFKIKCEGDKKFLEYMCNFYINKNK